MHVELGQNVLDVRRNRLPADRELASSFFGREAADEVVQHFQLALGEAKGRRRRL